MRRDVATGFDPVGLYPAVRRGARDSVEHAQAVEEERTREAAQEHVFERALARERIEFVEADQDVKGEGHHLKRDVGGD